MTLLEKIDTQYLEAMKAKDAARISTLRLLKSALKNKEIETRKTLEDADILSVIQSQIKTRRDSVEMFLKGNRAELAEKEKAEITILQEFLPAQLSADQLKAKIEAIINETGAQSIQDMGKVMGKANADLKGQADMSEVSKIVKDALTK